MAWTDCRVADVIVPNRASSRMRKLHLRLVFAAVQIVSGAV
jgi:hypothetical protein